MPKQVMESFSKEHDLQVAVGLPWYHPLLWLKKGICDFIRAPIPSIAYGLLVLIITTLAIRLVFQQDYLFMLLPLLGCFIFIGPALALGLYDISRSLQRKETPDLLSSFSSWIGNGKSILYIAIILSVLVLTWVVLTYAIITSFFNLGEMHHINEAFFVEENSIILGLIVVYGILISLVVLGLTAISMPMLIDKPVDAFSAMLLSFLVFMFNKKLFLFWAFLIVSLIAIGFFTYTIGLFFIFPVLGYASWHAYKDMLIEVD